MQQSYDEPQSTESDGAPPRSVSLLECFAVNSTDPRLTKVASIGRRWLKHEQEKAAPVIEMLRSRTANAYQHAKDEVQAERRQRQPSATVEQDGSAASVSFSNCLSNVK